MSLVWSFIRIPPKHSLHGKSLMASYASTSACSCRCQNIFKQGKSTLGKTVGVECFISDWLIRFNWRWRELSSCTFPIPVHFYLPPFTHNLSTSYTSHCSIKQNSSQTDQYRSDETGALQFCLHLCISSTKCNHWATCSSTLLPKDSSRPKLQSSNTFQGGIPIENNGSYICVDMHRILMKAMQSKSNLKWWR